MLVVQPNKKIGSADVISRAALSVFSFLLSAPQAAKHSALSTSPNQPEEDVEHRKVKRPKLASHSAPKAEKGNDKEPAEVCQCAAGKQTSVQVRYAKNVTANMTTHIHTACGCVAWCSMIIELINCGLPRR